MKNDVLIKEVKNSKELKQIIHDYNKLFYPSIESQVNNLDNYAIKLYNYSITIKAVLDKKIVGFASFYCNDNETFTAYLTQIAVSKEVRGKKIGQLLLDEVIKISSSKKMKYLKLEVHNENDIAYNFYKKNEFYEIGKASDNSKYMRKILVGELHE